MNTVIVKYKGIHPGIVLNRLLDKMHISQRPFALMIGEYPQTLNAITKGRRKLNTALALKIEKQLELQEGTLALLQTYFDIEEEKRKASLSKTPNLLLLRKSLFWDTDINKIDWDKQYRAVIQRVFERGNDIEKNEVKRFYGKSKIDKVLALNKRQSYTIYRNQQTS
ncbi:helix-turn-helix domain-containing protein [Flavobacterium sp. xlx-214]|uniref:helix-turn-helix transcriptional regulator n=1 Tax=unclassified Flavobacterium TaxID=196869 RepID=UPI0013D79A08|nr:MULTISPECIES: helix-turn-helix domain-containing protein [unclassified Flavobacterium]MBA5791685.1 helix-turn-helix domain-containing protein [Flavobacterium sp. xlx-221]QMI82928.1 helix-turn-helix domain-containing protein [Flavobacterium sp. xlx-214]